MRCAVPVLLLVACEYLNAQQASLSGMAINTVTHQPLDGVHITLLRGTQGVDAIENYGATSGADGHFSFPNVNPGGYTVQARRNGFVYIQNDNKDVSEVLIRLKAGDAVAGRIVEMMPNAIISGRVVDEFGDPAEGAFVRADSAGARSSTSAVLSRMFTRTDERGMFRITGAPGKFRVSATFGPAGIAAQEVRTDGSEIPVYAETWYPSSDSKDRGALVDAVAGRESAGVDIRMVRKRSLTISGVVTGTREGSRAEVIVYTKFRGFPRPSVDAEGRFSLSGLPADRYFVWAHYHSGDVELNSAPAEVLLETANETGLNLRLEPAEPLLGTLEFESTSFPSQKPQVRLRIAMPINWLGADGDVDAAGKFTLSPVFPARYRVQVDDLPENAFIRAVSVDGAPVPNNVIDLSRGAAGSKIRIAISPNGASIEGAVTSSDGKETCCAMIALADRIENVTDHMLSTRSGATYRFTGLHPGKYRLIVSGPSRDYGTQAAEELFAQSPEIELHEGEHITRDVTFKPRGAE